MLIFVMNNCKNPIIIIDKGVDKNTGKHVTQCILINQDKLWKNADPYEYARIQGKINKNWKYYVLGCGHCTECKLAYAKEKSIRCYCESVYSKHNFFITLTYSDKYLPTGPTVKTTMQHHLANFIRNLKDSYPDLKYFACGERGETFDRPHMHINLFYTNIDITYQNLKMKSRIIEKYWPYGNIDIEQFYPGTAQYTAGYTAGSKKKTIFISQSRNLGERYILEHSETLLTTGNIMIDGKTVPMSRWAFKILEKNGFYIDELKDQKNKLMQDKLTTQLGNLGQNYDQYLKEQREKHNLIPLKRKGVDYQ